MLSFDPFGSGSPGQFLWLGIRWVKDHILRGFTTRNRGLELSCGPGYGAVLSLSCHPPHTKWCIVPFRTFTSGRRPAGKHVDKHYPLSNATSRPEPGLLKAVPFLHHFYQQWIHSVDTFLTCLSAIFWKECLLLALLHDLLQTLCASGNDFIAFLKAFLTTTYYVKCQR